VNLAVLLLEIIAALGKLLGLRSAALATQKEQQAGAAMQRAEDMQHEEDRIRSAARADLEFDGLHQPEDQWDRDSQK
jgi:hypothetical protein